MHGYHWCTCHIGALCAKLGFDVNYMEDLHKLHLGVLVFKVADVGTVVSCVLVSACEIGIYYNFFCLFLHSFVSLSHFC